MKHLKFLFLAVLAVAFIACDNDEPKDEGNNGNNGNNVTVNVTEGTYVGTVSVNQNDGTSYTQENVTVEILKTDDSTMTLTMKKVKFAERMPITLDMVIAGIATESTADEMKITGDSIIPVAMGGPFPQYTVTGFEGKVTNEAISCSMKCGEYPLTFSGVVQK